MKTTILLSFLLVIPTATSIFSGENIIVNQPVQDDAYVAGGTVTLNAPVYGDLIVVGGNVTINDSIHQDLIVAGGTIIINGYVADDIRCTGGTIQLSKNVGDDAVIAGGKFIVDDDAVIGGNLYVAGGQLQINGKIKGELMSRSGELEFNGSVEQDMDARGENIKVNGSVLGSTTLSGKNISIGTGASFQKEIRFWNPEGTLEMSNSMTAGQAVYDESLKLESPRWELLGFTSFLLLLWYLGTALLMISLFQYLFGSTLQKAAGSALKESLKSMGYGVLFCVSLPITIVIAFITIIGIPIAIILFFIMITLIMLATAITSLVAAHWINQVYYSSSWKTIKLVFASFGIFIFLKLASLTPFVGPLIMMLLIFLAYGSILLNIKWKKELNTSA